MRHTIGLLVVSLIVMPQRVPAQGGPPPCLPDNGGLTLSDGFCALIVADGVGRARHLVVAPNGDLLVATADARRRGGESTPGGVVTLRDTDGDGVADVQRKFGPAGGTGIALSGGFLYFGTDDAVVRWRWSPGLLDAPGVPDTIAFELLNRGQHAAKGIAVHDGALYVNIGVPSNACMERGRTPGSPGQDPCPLLENSGGIWRFDADRTGQRQSDGTRFVTGVRNTFALAVRPTSGVLYGVQHGRDDLHRLWPDHFTQEDNAEKPAEEMLRLTEGANYGWPYCYYDPDRKQRILAPEYGGDGETVGRCAQYSAPAVAFPAHWGPNGLTFYTGTQFPAEYRGGAFVAFHGSWNRAPLPQAGYNVTFVPFENGEPTGSYRVFADGFAGDDQSPRGAAHRPSGVAVGPDGSLYVSDDQGGRIYRIIYHRGSPR